MNMERAALRGRVAVLERELRELKIKANGISILLKQELPLLKTLEGMDAERIRSFAGQLADAVDQLNTAKTKLSELENELNG